jgi:hypothetical protein
MKIKYLPLISILCLGCGQNIEQIKNDLLPNVKVFVENEIKEDTVKSFLKFDTIFINRIDTLNPKERSTYFANLLTWRLDLIKMNSDFVRDLLNIKKDRSYLKYYSYGSYSNEMILNKKTGATFNYQFNNCLIKFNNASNQYTNDPLYQFTTDPVHYNGIIQNMDPKFLNITQNKLNIDNSSAAFAKGNTSYIIPVDIIGNARTTPPDLGAYQNKPFPPKK